MIAPEKLEEHKKKVEAILFSIGKEVTLEDLKRLTKIRFFEDLNQTLKALQEQYKQKPGSLQLTEDDGKWKLTVKDDYIPLIKNIVTDTDLNKGIMETLGVIAWKYPILQADVIKIRTNKAYDHLRELEKRGFIARDKHGKTIRLTGKFFDYFDLPHDQKKAHEEFMKMIGAKKQQQLEEKEKSIDDGEKIIQEGEIKKQQVVEEQRKRKEQEKKLQSGDLSDIELLDEEGHEVQLKEYEEVKTEIVDNNPEVDLIDETTDQPKKLEVYEEKEEPEKVEQETKEEKPEETNEEKKEVEQPEETEQSAEKPEQNDTSS